MIIETLLRHVYAGESKFWNAGVKPRRSVAVYS